MSFSDDFELWTKAIAAFIVAPAVIGAWFLGAGKILYDESMTLKDLNKPQIQRVYKDEEEAKK